MLLLKLLLVVQLQARMRCSSCSREMIMQLLALLVTMHTGPMSIIFTKKKHYLIFFYFFHDFGAKKGLCTFWTKIQ